MTQQITAPWGDLTDRVAIVTGAGSGQGIGYATCALLHQLGARVYALDLRFQQDGEGLWTQLECDVSDADACRAVVNQVLADNLSIDILVNNAGIISATRIPDMETADFNRMLEVNAGGAFNVTHAALEGLKQRGAAIVNVASIAAQRGGGLQGGAHYAASKGAIASFTKACARELGRWGIRANYVNPGVIETGMTDGKFSAEQLEVMNAQIPLGRMGTAHEVASTIAFLASPAAAYVTGTAVDVNGGYHIH